MDLEYVKNKRGLKFIELGMRCKNTYLDKYGTIKGGNSSGNIDVLFDGESDVSNVHPEWAMEYYDEEGNVISEYGNNEH